MAKAALRQQLITVTGISGTFMSRTGGDITSDTNKVYDGGKKIPSTIASPSVIADVVTARGYDTAIDGPILKILRQKVGSYRTTVKVTDLDEDLVAIGNTRTYSGALLIGLTEPEGNASSGDAQMWQATWSCSTVAG